MAKKYTKNNTVFSLDSLYINKIIPKSVNQAGYIRSIAENTLTLCYGSPGSGKSYLATAIALQYLKEGRIDKILFTRPLVQCGDGLGFLKGDLYEKVTPYMRPVLDEASKIVGKEHAQKLIEEGYIEILPLELMRGMNFHNTFMILDESQNCTTAQIKMFLTRVGQHSKCVLSGDVEQTDLFKCDYASVAQKLTDCEDVGIVEFGIEDIVRSSFLKNILTRL